MAVEAPVVGRLIEGKAFRDAIHVAVAPVDCGDSWLGPGEPVFLRKGKGYGDGERSEEESIGIVDPYLKEPVYRGQRFWLFLYLGTVEGLRHA